MVMLSIPTCCSYIVASSKPKAGLAPTSTALMDFSEIPEKLLRVTNFHVYPHFFEKRKERIGHERSAKRLPLHTATQDAVDLPKMVQVVCRFQADELLDRLPSAYLVDPIALHPPCARDRLQQSQVALA